MIAAMKGPEGLKCAMGVSGLVQRAPQANGLPSAGAA